MRVVLDSNVLIAALSFGGLCREVVDVCIDDHRLFISEHIFTEVRNSLTGKLSLPPEQIDPQVEFIKHMAQVVEPVAVEADACRDPDDLPVLGTMLAGNACLVTGDKDLLTLKTFHGHSILSPREFWDRLHISS